MLRLKQERFMKFMYNEETLLAHMRLLICLSSVSYIGKKGFIQHPLVYYLNAAVITIG